MEGNGDIMELVFSLEIFKQNFMKTPGKNHLSYPQAFTFTIHKEKEKNYRVMFQI
jgi:hypothetical protein